MKKLILLLLLMPVFALAQKHIRADSLKASYKADSIKAVALFNETKKLALTQDKKIPEKMQQLIKLCENKTNPFFINMQGDALGMIATFYKNIGQYDIANTYYNKMMKFGADNKTPFVIAKANIGFGLIADYRADYETAIDKNILALKYFESVNDSLGIAATTGNIGNAYIRLDQHQKAISWLNRSGDMYMKKKMTASVGNYYANLARAYKGLGDKKKEEELKLKAFAIFTDEGYKKGLATVGSTLGSFYASAGRRDEALNYYTISLKNAWQINDVGNIAITHCNVAHLYIKLSNPEKALIHADSAIYYSKKSGDRLAQAEAALVKGIALHMQRNNIVAADFIDRHISLRDSIYNNKMQSKVADMEVRYETEKKENQIALLHIENNNKSLQLKNNQLELNKKQLLITEQDQILTINQLRLKNQEQTLANQKLDAEKKEADIKSLQKLSRIQTLEIKNRGLEIKQRNYALAVIMALIVAGSLLGYAFYNRYKSKQVALIQQQRIEQQEHLTQAIIAAEEKERSRIASDLHDGVGQLFSAVKMNLGGLFDRVHIAREEDRFLAEKTMALVEESCKEVRVISHQMMPNMLLRSGIASDVKNFIEKIDSERLKVNVEAIGFKNKLESNVEIVLYRVIQESVNNVIKHAKATLLDIKLVRDGSGISTSITDNGIGFNTALKSDFEGIGLKNIATRIEYLKGTVAYESAPGMGTRVKIWVPVA